MGLNNPSCTSKPCAWLPNNQSVKPVKITDLKLERDNFGKKRKTTTELNSSKKNRFNPIATSKYKLRGPVCKNHPVSMSWRLKLA